MTVAELIEALKAMPQDAPVLTHSGRDEDVEEVTIDLGWAKLYGKGDRYAGWLDRADEVDEGAIPAVWV